MEVEDALSAKFKALVEGLMATTVSELVKMFNQVLLETRLQITHSSTEMEALKNCEQEKAQAARKDQNVSQCKREDVPVEVSSTESVVEIPEEPAEDISRSSDTSVCSAEASVPEMVASLKNAGVAEEPACQATQYKDSEVNTAPPVASLIKTTSDSTSAPPEEPSTTEELPQKPVENNQPSGKRKAAKVGSSLVRGLRDRQSRRSQKHCSCCSDDCFGELGLSLQRFPNTYVCRKCEKTFKTYFLFKNHKCPMPQECSKCAQTFITVRDLSAHNWVVDPPLRCEICSDKFATRCDWSLHKATHGDVSDELKSKKFEVRLERISDSQLEALSTKHAFLKGKPSHPASVEARNPADVTSASAEINETSQPEPNRPDLPDAVAGKSMAQKIYAVMSNGLSTKSPGASGSRSLRRHESDKKPQQETETQPADSEGSNCSSSSLKRKAEDCSHDAFNGVFPVEHVLQWKRHKGKKQVRVKWMPCSLCGARFQNTWEPLQSFPSLLDAEAEKRKTNKRRRRHFFSR